HKGVLVGYADAKIHPFFSGQKVISDIWILPWFRNRGHFHRSFLDLVKYTSAVGLYIVQPKYELYGGWFESLGFDWITAFKTDPSDDPANATLFLVTRDAYKDLVRFVIKYDIGAQGAPSSERGRVLFEEVQRELENENS